MSYFSTRLRIAGCLLGVSLILPARAWAAGVEDEGSSLEKGGDIKVVGRPLAKSITDTSATGSRLGISVLDTPATVSQISGADIRLRDDNFLNEAVTRAVGVTTQAGAGNGYTGLAARGFASSSISVLYNGVKSLINIGSGTFPYDIWNVEQIDVLNGPASVLFGGGAIGGAVNVLSRVPKATSSTTVRISGGSFDTFRQALDTTGALNSDLLYRLDVSHQSSNGYVDRGKSESIAATATISYQINATLKLTVSNDFSHNEPMIYNGLPLIDGRIVKALRRVNYVSEGSRIQFTDDWAHATLEWQPSANFTVSNTVSYIYGRRLWKYPSQFNYQPTSNNILVGNYATFQQRQRQYNNHLEARWNQPLIGMANTLSFGLDADYLDNIRRQHIFAGTTTTNLYNSDPPPFIGTTFTPTDQQMFVKQVSPFVEDRLAVTPALSILAGLRFDRLDVKRRDLVTGSEVSKVYSPISWRVGTVYEIANSVNLYAQFSKAVDPVANICCISAAQVQFALSAGKQVEGGIKGSLLNGRLEWTLAGYHISKNNLLIPSPSNPNITIQVGGQSSYGGEAMLSLLVVPGLRLQANGTLLHAKYDDFSERVGSIVVSRAGNRPVGVPDRSGNLWAIWDANSQLQLQGGLRYVGKLFINTANTLSISGYAVADAGISVRLTPKIVAQVHVSNLFDRLYATNYVSNGRGGGQSFLAAPRSANLILTAGF